MSDTPETDALNNLRYRTDLLFAHARKLERQRNELRTQELRHAEQWADEDTEIKAVCEKHGIVTDDGSGYFISRVACVEQLSDMLAKVTAERDKWKASHDNQVELKRILTDRPDLKERAASMQKLIAERDSLREQLETLPVIASKTWQRTCLHHTDKERSDAGCPVCASKEIQELKQLKSNHTT